MLHSDWLIFKLFLTNEDEADLWSADLFLYEDTMSYHFKDRINRYFDRQYDIGHSVKYSFRLSTSHHTLSDLTLKNTLTSPSDHHSVAVVQDVSRERTPKRARAAAETNPTKRRPITTVLILNKYQNGIVFCLIFLHIICRGFMG